VLTLENSGAKIHLAVRSARFTRNFIVGRFVGFPQSGGQADYCRCLIRQIQLNATSARAIVLAAVSKSLSRFD
jgi:hypothetical protein